MTNCPKTITVQLVIDAFITGDTEQYYILRDQIAKYVNTHRGLSKEVKEDIVADTLGALLQNFRNRRFRGDSIKALNVYIFMIVRNTVSNHLRKTNDWTGGLDSADMEDTGSTPPDTRMADKDLITKVLSQIEEKCAVLLRMKFHLGMSNQEVSERLSMTKNAASTAISRCLDRAKKLKIIKELV